MRAIRTLIATAGATAASGLLLAGGLAPAGASTDGPHTLDNECIEYAGTIGCFDSSGDHIVVRDETVDGRFPVVEWETEYGRFGACQWTGTTTWTDCNYNLREGSPVYFRLVLISEETGEAVDGTSWVEAYA
jgi:hypothetical protein